HWAGIKHKKALVDAKRGKIWTRIVREITIAAKLGGGDANGNPRLRRAVDDAKAANMPAENVKRAIQKGTGELPGAVYEELTYEGYAPGGVAVLVEVTTDNRNRTADDVSLIFTKNGGNRGTAGCVSWMFKPKSLILVKKDGVAEDALIGDALDAGAEDVSTDVASVYEVYGAAADLEKIRQALADKKYPIESAENVMKPDTLVALDELGAAKLLKLVEMLEEHDDVKSVHTNADIPEDVLAKLA
ncbi:MAG: YebC/PmpR family DNA-binding transcriptional regulator, partial [Elusimicrobia bacterium]|nr:YebC/PmpR family DNA-binding transcriptional regulator [Elusimicrobiota bacterium]